MQFIKKRKKITFHGNFVLTLWFFALMFRIAYALARATPGVINGQPGE
jgi:hypothetical protein